MTNTETLLAILGVAEPKPGVLTEGVRVRVDADQLRQLDRIEAYARGKGHRSVTRSALIRSALTEFIAEMNAELGLNKPADASR